MKTSRIKKYIWIMVIGWVFLLTVIHPAYAGEIGESLLERMAESDPDEKIPVIIRFVDKTTPNNGNQIAAEKLVELLQNNAAASQGLIRALLRSKGITKIVSLWIINGIAVELTTGQILDMADHPDVESIVLDDIVLAPELPEASPEATVSIPAGAWDNLEAIEAPALWVQGIDGSGVVVASMDTGVDKNHQDLSSSWRGGTNSWYDPHKNTMVPYDPSGHGTQVMGIMVGGKKSGEPIGVAPGARWIAVKLFDDSGKAQYRHIHLGFQWLLNPDGLPDTDDVPHIVNNSWGLTGAAGQCITEFQEDVRVFKNAGIAVVFSAGNNGPGSNTSGSPANYPESFAVGAVDENLIVANTSSRGPSACDGSIYPEVTAPGVDIFTSDKGSTSYKLVTGTSYAAPHAAGAMALLKDAYPGARADDLELALIQSAFDLGTSKADNTYGYGLIDLSSAVNELDNPPGCVDNDDDGYFASPGCGTLVDCNDNNKAINPAASEIKNDGIDQNCNGYDLTINIVKAVYVVSEDKLDVEATSALGQNAGLVLENYGSMKWDRKKSSWIISVRAAGGDPGVVVVTGTEGSEKDNTTVDTSSSSPGGGKGKNK